MKCNIVFVTVGNEEEGKKIARQLVEEKLAACVNIVPNIQSVYWWEGKIEESQEYFLIIKTSEECVKMLIERVKQLHSYAVPEVIAIDIVQGNPDYLNWITDSVQCTSPSFKK